MKFDKASIRILLATRQKFLISIGIGLLSFILLVAVMIPQIQETFSLYSKLNAETPLTDKLRKKLAALEGIVNTAEYAQIHVVDQALPSKKPLLELLMSLYTLSSETGIAIHQFQLSPGLVASDSTTALVKTNSKSYDSLELTMKISGTFKQIQDFLLQAEKASPFTTVTKLDIGGVISGDKNTDKDAKIFQADLTTSTFFFTQAISVRIETPLPILAVKEQNVLATLASFIPNKLPEQKGVEGGGLEDLFGVSGFAGAGKAEYLEQLLQKPVVFDVSELQSGKAKTGSGSAQTTP